MAYPENLDSEDGLEKPNKVSKEAFKSRGHQVHLFGLNPILSLSPLPFAPHQRRQDVLDFVEGRLVANPQPCSFRQAIARFDGVGVSLVVLIPSLGPTGLHQLDQVRYLQVHAGTPQPLTSESCA